MATVNTNQKSCDTITSTSWMPNIFEAMTLLMPIGVNHKMHVLNIFMETSNSAEKKSVMTLPFGPMVLRNIPKIMQKKTSPSEFVPLR